jgi:hypothetical protein
MGVVNTSTSRGHNFCIRSSFGALGTSSERSIRGVHISNGPINTNRDLLDAAKKKKCRLGPQNDPESLGPEKCRKTTKMETVI